MSEFVNFCKEIYFSNKEKIKTPFYSFYLLILILWNWDVLSYYFFSDENISIIITNIKSTYSGWWRILNPLFYSILISLLFPFLISLMELLLQYPNDWRRELRYKALGKVRAENLKKAQHDYKIEQEKSGLTAFQDFNKKIEELTSQLSTQKAQHETSKQFYEYTIDEQKNLNTEKDKKIKELTANFKELKIIANRPFSTQELISLVKVILDIIPTEEYILKSILKAIHIDDAIINYSKIQAYIDEEIPYAKIQKRDIAKIIDILKKYDIISKEGNTEKLTILGKQLIDTLYNSFSN
jgi:hypothetical protein